MMIPDMTGPREIDHRTAPGLRVAKSSIDGRGCFAAVNFRKGEFLAEYVGKRITCAEAEQRQLAPGKKFVCDVDQEWSIDGSLGGNGTQYINHSCDPNAYLIISQGRLFLHALRDINSAEEITAEYWYELELDKRACSCRTAACVENSRLT